MVSRHHARLYWAGGQYVVEDLGSANGVFYQEQRVARHSLKHGDAVRCGSLWLRFIDAQPAFPGPQAAYAGGSPVGHMGDPAQFAAQLVNQNVPQAGQPLPQAGAPIPQPMTPPGSQPLQGGVRPGDPAAQFAAQLVNQNVPQPGQPMVPHLTPSGGMPAVRPPTPAAVAPAPIAIPPSAPMAAIGADSSEEVKRLNRRIEQLQTELRLYRGGKGADVAQRLEELEGDNSKLEQQVAQLKGQLKTAESTLATAGGDVRVQRADKIAVKTQETVQQLNDILSNLRINVMAAEGEFEQFSHQIPRASFELIREALRSSAGDVDTARETLRVLRDLAD